MKIILKIIAIVLPIVAIHSADGHAQVVVSNSAAFMPVEIARTLDSGFRAGDKKPLESFLSGWHQNLKPIADDILRKKPDFEREVYAIYMNFYTLPKWADKANYRVVQDSVDITLTDGDLYDFFAEKGRKDAHKVKTISRVTILGFRPAANAGSGDLLYFDRQCLDVLLRFLTKTDKNLLDAYATEPNGVSQEARRTNDSVREARLLELDPKI